VIWWLNEKNICWIELKNFYYVHFEYRHIEIIDRLIIWGNHVDSGEISKIGSKKKRVGLSRAAGKTLTL